MKKLFNFIVVCLVVATVNLFSMHGSREGVVSREHALDMLAAEEAQKFQEALERLEREDREELQRQEMARRQWEIEREWRRGTIFDLRNRLERRTRD
jgi:hypothetical protein